MPVISLSDGEPIEIVASYRYLGVEVAHTGSSSAALDALSAAGSRACSALRSRCAEIHLYDPHLKVQLFDSLVQPILLHGAEIWGVTSQIGLNSFGKQERDGTEVVHRGFLRSLLGVRASISSIAILGEFGRYPLLVRRFRAISLYDNRLLHLRGSGRLVSLAFEDSFRLWEEAEYLRCSSALIPGIEVPYVQGWFADFCTMFNGCYGPANSYHLLSKCNTQAAVSYIQSRYLKGAHR